MKTMRKIFMSLPFLALGLVGCEERTPYTDTTKLWPAGGADGKYGYIDQKGTMKIPAMYDYTTTFSCGYALVQSGENLYFIDKKGNIQGGMSFDDANPFFNDYAVFELDGKYGLLNKKLEYQIQPIYSWLGDFRDGLAYASMQGDKYGFVNKSGKYTINEIYKYAYDFIDGLAPVSNDGTKWGCVNSKGEYVVSPVYDAIYPYSSKMAPFERDGKIGFLNTSGKEAVMPIYEDASHFFENDLAPVCLNGKYGYIDKKGNVKIATQYDYAFSFSEGYAIVANYSQDGESATAMVIDTKGNVVFTLPKGFGPSEAGGYFHNGLLLIGGETDTNNKWEYRYIDTKGNMVYSWTEDYSYYAPQKVSKNKDMKKVPTKHFSLGHKK